MAQIHGHTAFGAADITLSWVVADLAVGTQLVSSTKGVHTVLAVALGGARNERRATALTGTEFTESLHGMGLNLAPFSLIGHDTAHEEGSKSKDTSAHLDEDMN
ncbi:uncharacterized protein TERG_11951 [Trichophyton rubrum CBS 118892]|uniref:Uncharacterized protein n=1 Tax=Trichophyton rubrum (strain ATCC MYA-4607 / CBS 118892) TaxID=559305 RepID=A0A080WI74_TRIRC|nr:uncharacterized protein TERG_11951 [Trichophyton rubrum CBS 118892]KFL61094.1 hypothetical protein TERG_11951 [Trichophyton rubrum CBS 118892]